MGNTGRREDQWIPADLISQINTVTQPVPKSKMRGGFVLVYRPFYKVRTKTFESKQCKNQQGGAKDQM